MKRKIQLTVAAVALVVAAVVTLKAGPEHMPAPKTGSKEFERMKQLVGKWQGTCNDMGKEEKGTVEYRLTSNGSALEERLFAGSPSEMVSIYYDRQGKLTMTHYCAMGNRPQLELKSATADTFKLSLAGQTGLEHRSEDHMHALTLEFMGADKLTQTWVGMMQGKEQKPTVIMLSRVK